MKIKNKKTKGKHCFSLLRLFPTVTQMFQALSRAEHLRSTTYSEAIRKEKAQIKAGIRDAFATIYNKELQNRDRKL